MINEYTILLSHVVPCEYQCHIYSNIGAGVPMWTKWQSSD